MASEAIEYPLSEAFLRRFRLSWFWTITIIAVVLVMLLILAAFLDGVINELSTWRFWQHYLEEPIVITYILAVHIFMWRLRNQAIQAFKPLLPLEEDTFNKVATEVAKPRRRWEWTFVFIGIGFTFVTGGQPWNLPWGPGQFWLSVYLVIIAPFYNGLLFWLIYDTLAGTVRIARLSRRNLKLDIFNIGLLAPIARWSLGMSLGFIGDTSLSLVFQTQESLLK